MWTGPNSQASTSTRNVIGSSKTATFTRTSLEVVISGDKNDIMLCSSFLAKTACIELHALQEL